MEPGRVSLPPGSQESGLLPWTLSSRTADFILFAAQRIRNLTTASHHRQQHLRHVLLTFLPSRCGCWPPSNLPPRRRPSSQQPSSALSHRTSNRWCRPRPGGRRTTPLLLLLLLLLLPLLQLQLCSPESGAALHQVSSDEEVEAALS